MANAVASNEFTAINSQTEFICRTGFYFDLPAATINVKELTCDPNTGEWEDANGERGWTCERTR